MRRWLLSFIALIAASLASAAVVSSAARAADTYYISPSEIDLLHILAPPPPPDSPALSQPSRSISAVPQERARSRGTEAAFPTL